METVKRVTITIEKEEGPMQVVVLENAIVSASAETKVIGRTDYFPIREATGRQTWTASGQRAKGK